MRSLFLLLFLAAHLFAQSPSPAPFPALRIQASVGTQQRRIGDSYRKTMEINPKLIVEGTGSLIRLPATEATMLVITMDTRAKYTQKKEVLQVHSTETLPLPAAPTGARRDFSFASSSVVFDSYRDNSNVGGEVYKYFICGIRAADSKTIVAFETNDPSLATFCKTHPEKREQFLSMKKGAKLPEDYK